MITLSVAISLLSNLLVSAATTISEQEWTSAEVNDVALADDTSLRKEIYVVSTLTLCLGLATRFSWVYLACYSTSGNNQCSLWELDALISGEVIKDETLGRTECKVRRDFEVPTPAPITCDTSSDYHDIDGVCVFIGDSTMEYNDAVTFCTNKGLNIASFETAEEFAEVVSYIQSNAGGSDYWVGMTKVSGVWRWSQYNRETDQSEWSSGEPNYGGLCSRMKRGGSFKMAECECDETYKPMCRLNQ